jgi:hypothetical protein
MMRRVLVLLVLLSFAVLPALAEPGTLEDLLGVVNQSIVADAVHPDLPPLDYIQATQLMTVPDGQTDTFYSVGRLSDILAVYSAYAKYFTFYQDEFAWLHNGLLGYFSDFCSYYYDRPGVNLVQLIGGFVQTMVGSIDVMCSADELNLANRTMISTTTKAIIIKWWPQLPVTMQTKIMVEVSKFLTSEKDPGIKQDLNDIKALYKIN